MVLRPTGPRVESATAGLTRLNETDGILASRHRAPSRLPRPSVVERDDAEIHLTLQPAHVATTANVLHLMVDDAEALHEHLQDHGVRIVKGIRDADYGMRTFVMGDPDGNRIDVGEDL